VKQQRGLQVEQSTASGRRMLTSRYSRRRALGVGASLAGASLTAALVGCAADDGDATSTPAGGTGSATTEPGSSGDGAIKTGGMLSQAVATDIPHMDPHTETYPAGFLVALVHAGLLRFAPSDDPRELIPESYLAESVEYSDPQTVVVTLRENVHFHDDDIVAGRAVTAEDVKFSIERIKTDEPEFQRRSFFTAVNEVTVVDERTAQINLSEPFAPLMTYLADTWNVIIPRELVERDGDMRESAVGAGPFRLTRHQPGTGMEFERNPNFFLEGRPYVDGVRIPILPDAAAILSAFQSKQTNFVRNINWADVPRFESDDAYKVGGYPDQSLQYVRLNLDVEPLGDERVRQAISYAIDREEVVATAFQGRGAVSGIFPHALRWAVPADDLPHYQYDPQEAIALLSAAGFGDGLVLENLRPATVGGLQQAETDVVSDQLARIGVTVEHRMLEYGAYLQAAFSREFQINIHYGNRYDDPDGYAAEYIQDGGRNFGSWGSDELDALIYAQRGALDEDERGDLFRQIQENLATEMYNVGLANWETVDGWSSALQNFGTSDHWFQSTQRFSEAWLSV